MQNKKAQKKLVYKPYIKGAWLSGSAALRGLRILAYYAAFAVAYVMMGIMLNFGSPILRWLVNMLVVAVCFMILFSTGSRDGESEVTLGEIAYAHEEAGQQVTKEEKDRCYHPLKGWVTFLCAAAVLWLLTVPHALTAQPQTYALQALPSWVGTFRGHEELTVPLSYYEQTAGITVRDILHLIVRILIFPFSNAVSTRSVEGVLTMDRLSPLLVLIPALGYPIGYLTGPRTRASVHGDISANQRRRQRKEKKARQARTEKKNELI